MKNHSPNLSRNAKAIIFDFDGTVAASLELGYEVIAIICKRYGYCLLEKDVFRMLSTRELMKRMGISLWRLPKLMQVGRELMAEFIPHVQPCEGIIGVVRELHARGYKLAIVTSNSAQNVRSWLLQQDIDEYISCIVGGGRLLRKDRCIKKALIKLGCNTQEVVYVGDETRDIIACKRLKIPVLAAQWGLDVPLRLAQAGPDLVLTCPQEIFRFLNINLAELDLNQIASEKERLSGT